MHTALNAAGLRGRADLLVEAADVLDVHSLAMALAAGATVVRPWLALELAAELAGGRGAETLSADGAAGRLLDAFEAGLRKTLARMGIAALASYVGGALFETLELAPEVIERCFPTAATWPGRVGFADLGERILRRAVGRPRARGDRTGDEAGRPGLARFRADGELHLYAPAVVKTLQAVANGSAADGVAELRTLARRDPATVRDGLRIRRPRESGPCRSRRSSRPARSPGASWRVR